MTITKTVKWLTGAGKTAEVRIESTREMIDDIAYADGWNINLGRTPYEDDEITVYVDGKYLCRERVLTLDQLTADIRKKLSALGAVAVIGNLALKQDNYDRVMQAVNDAKSEAAQDPEYAAYITAKSQEAAERAAKVQAELDAKFAEARATGEPVVIRRWMSDCHAKGIDCSFDSNIEYAMPDGTTKIEWSHCH
jgi:hypothetical protein